MATRAQRALVFAPARPQDRRLESLWLPCALALCFAACGASDTRCSLVNCPAPSEKLYTVCAVAGSTVTTESTDGGAGCQIDTANEQTAESSACAQSVEDYCAE